MQMYITRKTNLERNYQIGLDKTIIEEFKTASSKVADIEGMCMALGDCPSCPSCVCADFLGAEFTTSIGIAASTPALLACKVALVCP